MDLAEELLKKNTHLTGTVMANRKNLPVQVRHVTCIFFSKKCTVTIYSYPCLLLQVKGQQLSKMKKGETKTFKVDTGTTFVTAWKDKRVVLMLSTFYGEGTDTWTRHRKGGQVEEIQKPTVVRNYNKFMGGVDRADQYIASYAFLRQSMRVGRPGVVAWNTAKPALPQF